MFSSCIGNIHSGSWTCEVLRPTPLKNVEFFSIVWRLVPGTLVLCQKKGHTRHSWKLKQLGESDDGVRCIFSEESTGCSVWSPHHVELNPFHSIPVWQVIVRGLDKSVTQRDWILGVLGTVDPRPLAIWNTFWPPKTVETLVTTPHCSSLLHFWGHVGEPDHCFSRSSFETVCATLSE